mgnify:CR=1 FL=1
MRKIKILGICGSPRRDGATELALRTVLDDILSVSDVFTVDFWTVSGKKISPCVHCDACLRARSMCVIQDDHQEIEQKILAADAIIMASPVYDMNISAQLSAVLNRMRPIYMVHSGVLENKVGAAITTGGTRYGGVETAKYPMLSFYLMNGMLVTGGGGGCYLGGSIWSQDKKSQGAREDLVGLETLHQLAKTIAKAAVISVLGQEAVLQQSKSRAALD